MSKKKKKKQLSGSHEFFVMPFKYLRAVFWWVFGFQSFSTYSVTKPSDFQQENHLKGFGMKYREWKCTRCGKPFWCTFKEPVCWRPWCYIPYWGNK